MSSSGYRSNLLGAGTGDSPQWAAVAFGGFAAALTTATAVTVLTLTRDQYRLKIANTTNVDMVVTIRLPGSLAATNVDLDSYATLTTTIEDLGADLRKAQTGLIIGAYARLGVAPASGDVKVSAL